jgi:diacylglycerol O-acyltransferase
MSAQDALWLTMDRPENLMVVDVVTVFGTPIDGDVLRDALAAMVDRHPVFRRRAERRGRSWWWVDDPEFTIDRHLSVLAVEEPVGMDHVQDIAAAERSRPLDPSAPLWSATVLQPVTLEDGSRGAAMIIRFHHAIADGVRLTQVLLGVLGSTAHGAVPQVARSGHGGRPDGVVSLARSAAQEVGHVATTAASVAGDGVRGALRDPSAVVGAAWSAVGWGLSAVRHPDRVLDLLDGLGAGDHRVWNDATTVAKLSIGGTDRTVWTGRPGTQKAVSWSPPLALDAVKEVAREHGATLNDILVAALAGALRRYLIDHGDPVDEVVWMVPVNLKPFDGDLPKDLGNHFALVMLDMPLTGATPQQRIADVRQRMSRIKNSDEPALTFGLQRAISAAPRPVATELTDFFANKAVGVLTNVPGPRQPLSLGGAPVRQVIGFAPCSGDQPLTATIFTYAGSVTVGFASDAALVPDPADLVELVLDELRGLGALQLA